MKAQSRKLGKLAGLALIVVVFLTISFSAEASYYKYNRNQARKTINKTAYIIDEAYSIANYYGYWSSSYLSRAVYYNEYAQEQFNHRNYRRAIQYSIKARDYALRVIDGCDSYWDYYYYENYGWSRNYGYNPYYTGSYNGNHYGNYNNYYNYYYSSSHNNYSSNPNYNPNKPNSYNDGRGGNGRSDSFDPNKPSTGGTQTGHLRDDASFKNLNTESYFDKTELGVVKDLPSETNMEENFKKDNRSVTFDDNNISSNTNLITNNRSRSQDFQKTVPQAQRSSIKIQEPRKIEEVVKTRETGKGVRIIDANSNEKNNLNQNNRTVIDSREVDSSSKRTNSQYPNRQIKTTETQSKTKSVREVNPTTSKTRTKFNSSTRSTKTEKAKTSKTKEKSIESKKTNSNKRDINSGNRSR